ncbi:hypothetical protein [Clostridiisalibacter paucivorans]|uniref:hypothetical protein n=1 Tax=Clostridiisalibacter paucivorans TaxID=408753 RepID=UPI000479476A|nr:hypothetical protein [Clostridiisalibacter paucivorans]
MILTENISIIKSKNFKILENIKHIENKDYLNNIKIEKTRNGLKTLYVNKDDKKIYIHSKYNPMREAESIINEYKDVEKITAVVFYGIGLGYHINVFLEKYPNVNYYIYEPIQEMLYTYLSNKFLKELPSNNLIDIVTGKNEETIKSFLKNLIDENMNNIIIVELPMHKQLFPEEHKKFLELFKSAIKTKKNNIRTDYNFKKRVKEINKPKSDIIEFNPSNIFLDPNIYISYDMKSLLTNQYNKKNEFNRMDIIVRYLAIEEYYGKNKYGFKFYEKMQKARGQKIHNIERFIKTIKSIEENGFDDDSPVLVDLNLQLIDGSHRLACALYFNFNKIPIKIQPQMTNIEYSIEWFKKAGFTDIELEKIKDKQQEILEEKGMFFVTILWPPVQNYFNEITEELKQEYELLSVKDYTFRNDYDFNATVRGLYAIDDIEVNANSTNI